mmetsp:Transcript_25637/g.50036  ORF Transcript_25637/g.50036 Transcript_25637/m.50036 type:complete len:264 (-) Transcript_25637:1380-2171(-)
MVLPALQCMDQSPRVARVHMPPIHGHLTALEALRLHRELERRHVGVVAVATHLRKHRHHELMKRRPPRGIFLLLVCQEAPHNPSAHRRAIRDLFGAHKVPPKLLRAVLDHLVKSLLGQCQQCALDSPHGQVQRDSAAQLGGGPEDEGCLGARGDLLQDRSRRESVAVHDAHLEVGVVLYEQRPAAIERLVLVQRPQTKHLDACLVRLDNRILDVRVDARPLPLEEELDGTCGRDPSLKLELAKAVLVRHENLAHKHSHRNEEV